MKDLVNGFAEFAAIIMILITLAVSTAAVAQLLGTGDEGGGARAERAAFGRG